MALDDQLHCRSHVHASREIRFEVVEDIHDVGFSADGSDGRAVSAAIMAGGSAVAIEEGVVAGRHHVVRDLIGLGVARFDIRSLFRAAEGLVRQILPSLGALPTVTKIELLPNLKARSHQVLKLVTDALGGADVVIGKEDQDVLFSSAVAKTA